MKLKELSTIVRKEFIYDCYCTIVDHPKEYNKITRNKMFDEIIKTYSNPQNILDSLSYNEYILLKTALEQNNQAVPPDTTVDRKIYHKFLMIPNFYKPDNILYIPEEIESYIYEAINKVSTKEIKKRDQLNNLITGLINIYGYIKVNDFIQIIQHYYPDFQHDELYQYLKTNRSLKDIISINEDHVRAVDFIDDSIIEIITEAKKHFRNIDYKIYEKKDVYKMANKEAIHPSYQNLVSFLEHNFMIYTQNNILADFVACVSTFCDPEVYIDWMIENYPFNGVDVARFADLFQAAYFHYPCTVIDGHCIDEIMTESDPLSDLRVQSDARISEEDCELFFKVYFALLEYANKKLKATNIKKIYCKKQLPLDKLIKIRNRLFKDNRDLIDTFIADNCYNFNDEELNIVYEFKKGICDECIIIEHQNDATIIGFKDNKTYKVKGLRSNIYEVTPAPAMAEILILPFKDVIVYDGLINLYPIQMSPDALKAIDEINKKQPPLSQITSLLS